MFKFFTKRKRDPKEVIQEVFGNCELPSFPTTVMELLGMLRDTDTKLSDVGTHIERDPGLSVKVLRTVNSAAFGLTSTVNHVGHAASLLGRSRLEAIVLSVAVKGAIPSGGGSAFNQNQFWETAAKRACLARTLAKHMHPATEFESFTAGLLQDMGIPLMFMQKKDAYARVYQAWQNDSLAMLNKLEYEAFGFDHTEVGSIIAESWDLPTYLVEAIGEHHNWEGEHHVDQAVQLVSLLRGSLEDDGKARLIEMGVSVFHEDSDQFSQLVEEGLERSKAYQKMLAG